MLNVTPGEGQGDCHLIEFQDGQKVLIDPAEGWDAQGACVSALQRQGVTKLDLIVISHFHWDHYGQLRSILKAGIQVRQVAYNLPADRYVADAEKPWGCNWDDVQALLEELRAAGISLRQVKAGDRLIEVRDPDGTLATMDVLCAFDGVNTPVGRTYVNDTSIVIRLTHGAVRVLFTGDLNHPIGDYLARSPQFDLRADIIKVPHHGTEGTVPDEFFDRIGARVALVPSPRELWHSPRSRRIRNYYLSRQIPVYVSGLNGNVKVVFTQTSYFVETKR